MSLIRFDRISLRDTLDFVAHPQTGCPMVRNSSVKQGRQCKIPIVTFVEDPPPVARSHFKAAVFEDVPLNGRDSINFGGHRIAQVEYSIVSRDYFLYIIRKVKTF